jgi:hypothetical protein
MYLYFESSCVRNIQLFEGYCIVECTIGTNFKQRRPYKKILRFNNDLHCELLEFIGKCKTFTIDESLL